MFFKLSVWLLYIAFVY